jgi:aminoglycoside 3-N-acetyltransferase
VSLRDAIAAATSGNVYPVLKRGVRTWRRFRLRFSPKLDEERVGYILRDVLGVRAGGVVFVHSSLDRLNLGFSAPQLLRVLLQTIGADGTALFPCTQISGRAEAYLRSNAIFDVRRSPTTMGLLSEIARRYPGALRSAHPTHSVVAIGRHARELIESHEHSIYPCDANSPYYKIVEFDGIIIGLGVTTRQLSFVHCVEDNLRHRFPLRTRTEEVYRATVRDRQGREVTIPTVAQTDVTLWLDIPRFMKRHVDPAVCRAVRLDGVDFFTARAKQLYVRMEELALKNVTCYTRGAYARHARARALP